ncbi:ABC transporter ATP-binding protein/permease [Vagococcus sp. PNs007]|uniref:ABC transporter ATP-binding protein/permease n=1 Tax=Vagococcus proximus TaxID=2991417 RepID=A0ABT5WY87_9ENTE|nr:ABC transporter ATP-binding protein [Vagococcus proximus]MDF0478718.1 ABC transporter ATP-binding protein/permease [Vagococcus proximus]
MLKIVKRMSLVSVFVALGFMLVQVMSDLYLPTLTSNIIDKGVAQGDIPYIWSVGGVMIGFSFISILAAIGNTYFATKEAQKLGKQLRSEIFSKVSHASHNQMDKFGTASLITRTTNDVNQIQMVAQMFLRLMIHAPITLVGASFLAYQKNAELTKVFLITIPILIVFIGIVMYFAVPLFKSMQKKTDRLNLVFREGLTGVRVIRAFNRGDYEADRFDEANHDFVSTAIKVNTIMAMMIPIVTVIMSGTTILIVWQGSHLIADMKMEVGHMIAFMTYATEILISFLTLSMIFIMVPRAQASAVRINEVLDLEDDLEQPKTPTALSTTQENVSLEFDHVDYRYKGAENLALKDVNFSLKGGETLAIIGGTGSGKTTLVNLIPRFFDIESGEIKLNGVPVNTVDKEELVDHIGFVPQKAMLFTGTIRENLQYGKENAIDEELWHALEIAQAKTFVSELEEGLDSHVEQGGGNFSGGQRQRLCIARALVKEADVFVFDDSFSALDFKTDAKLRDALKKDIKEEIVVIVAQRISTVIDADLILVIDEGKIVGQGTHDELKESCETYQEIISSQMREEEIA